jgi:sarcosine oxidase subunit beta
VPDVVIVGAGVVGLSTAFALANRGIRDVIVVERRHIGAGASGKSGAIIRTHYTNEPETRLAIEGLRFFQNWADLVGGDCGFATSGMFIVVPPQSADDLAANVAMQQSLGVRVDLVTADEARAIDPSLSLGDGGVTAFEHDAGTTDSMAVCNGLADAVERAGVTIVTDTRVTAIRHQAGHVTGVDTAAGRIDAGTVVLAPGAFAHRLLQPLGIDLPMAPATSRIAIFRWPRERAPRHPVLLDNVNGLWLRPIFGESTLIGAERGVRRVVDDPEQADETIDMTYVDHCRTMLATRYPVMRHAVARGGWTGILMRTADGRPIIGPFDGYAGLLGLVGDSGTSFKTAPAIGRALAELIVDGSSETDLSPFHASRFADGGRWTDEREYAAGASISR